MTIFDPYGDKESPLKTRRQEETTLNNPTPPIKAVGGKRQLLPELLKYVPKKYRIYYEPFVGGGALFFALQSQKAVLADLNGPLIHMYWGVQNNVKEVVRLLRRMPRDKKRYLQMRLNPPKVYTDRDCAARAAWFIYMNKCGFNGLWRVNKSGEFNVPFGDNKGAIYDEANLVMVSRALKTATLKCCDFEEGVFSAKKGDFCYMDPPYVPVSVTSNFTAFTKDGFGFEEQVRLRNVAVKLKEKGVHVILSNSSAPLVKELYSKKMGFQIIEVEARRSINCKGDSRGAVKEVIIR